MEQRARVCGGAERGQAQGLHHPGLLRRAGPPVRGPHVRHPGGGDRQPQDDGGGHPRAAGGLLHLRPGGEHLRGRRAHPGDGAPHEAHLGQRPHGRVLVPRLEVPGGAHRFVQEGAAALPRPPGADGAPEPALAGPGPRRAARAPLPRRRAGQDQVRPDAHGLHGEAAGRAPRAAEEPVSGRHLGRADVLSSPWRAPSFQGAAAPPVFQPPLSEERLLGGPRGTARLLGFLQLPPPWEGLG
mmetsp:Transcript_44720/g.120509  ORF Transcript_44720/g.120509 Transcript_44720/m.120509 type:complete len:241 (+) Transcript_44720:320-1042(+)